MTHATHMITSPERLQFAGRRNIAAGGAVWRQAMPAAMLLAVVAAASPVHATSLVPVIRPAGGQTVAMVPNTAGVTTTVTASGAIARLFLRIGAVMT